MVHALPVQKIQADPNQVGLFAQLEQPKVGFIVSKRVGNAVVRKRVTRQLKHLMRELLPQLNVSFLVIRANSAAADASYPQLQQALTKQFSQQKLWKNGITVDK